MNIPPCKNKYRNKITLQVIEGKIGLFKTNTNQLIKINNCLLISDEMNKLIKELEKLPLNEVSQIIIREASNQLMIKFIGTIDKEVLLNTISNQVASIYINDENIYGSKYHQILSFK